MSRHNDNVSLRQMLEHSREARNMAAGQTRASIEADRMRHLALIHLVQIIGEAARRVSPPFQAAHAEIAWAQIIAFRNRMVHGYDSVDFDTLWAIVTTDIPALVMNLE